MEGIITSIEKSDNGFIFTAVDGKGEFMARTSAEDFQTMDEYCRGTNSVGGTLSRDQVNWEGDPVSNSPFWGIE